MLVCEVRSRVRAVLLSLIEISVPEVSLLSLIESLKRGCRVFTKSDREFEDKQHVSLRSLIESSRTWFTESDRDQCSRS